jgi:hypothetical protein
MSLTSFLDLPDVTAAVKPLRPKTRRMIDEPLRAEPRSDRYGIVGTAFDYLLRFELQRRAPHAVTKTWVAEGGCALLGGGLDFLRDIVDPKAYPPPPVLFERAWSIVWEAKAAVASYVKSKSPTPTQRSDLAAHAIRLAKLDQVFRERRLDPRFEEAAREDVEDLLSMLKIVPFDSLLDRKTMLLNPTLRESSLLVGGADMDLIAGDLLVDFKVTKIGKVQARDLDQLLGYYLLTRHRRRHDPSFPEIKRAALYSCRHGLLIPLDVTVWTSHPDFPRIEEWFFKRAEEVFGKHVERQKRLLEQAKVAIKRGR